MRRMIKKGAPYWAPPSKESRLLGPVSSWVGSKSRIYKKCTILRGIPPQCLSCRITTPVGRAICSTAGPRKPVTVTEVSRGFDDSTQCRLVAWSHNSGEPAVIRPVIVVPERKPCLDSGCQNAQLFIGTGRRLCTLKSVGFHGGKIFIVPKLINRLKYVPHRLLSRKNGSKRPDSALNARGKKAFSNDADDVQIVGQVG